MTAMSVAPTTPRSRQVRARGINIFLIAVLLLGCVLFVATPGRASAQLPTGAGEVFWTLDWGAGVYKQTSASVLWEGEHAVIYVSDGDWVSPFVLEQLGTAFDSTIYPALTEAYGSEPNPGIDGDPRVNILIYNFNDPRDDVDGSFNFRDIDPEGATYTNRREIIYINLQALLAEPMSGPTLAAHEFTHLILYYRGVMLDPSPDAADESTWITEGFTTYGEHLAGFDDRVAAQVRAFARGPNFSLTHWQGLIANYGASYSFMRYMAERGGPGFTRALVEQPLDGVTGIDTTLAACGSMNTFASLFDDWILAGLLDGRSPQLPPYCFDGFDVAVEPVPLTGPLPLIASAKVVDYGACYLDFPVTSSRGAFQAVIDGEAGAPLQAALVSWDTSGALVPVVTRFDLANPAVGGTVTGPAGYDRHTLVVWARGIIGSTDSYEFVFSGAVNPPADTQFLDMGGGDPFYQYVGVLLDRGVISGKEIPSGSKLWFFMGKDNVLRAQFAKMIMQATGLHTPDVDNVGNPTFSDVKTFDANGYPYDFIEEAAALGIVNGYSGGVFKPYDPITRAQLVLMITRGATAAGKPLPLYVGSTKVFSDVPLSHPYYRQIMTAYQAGILSGKVGSGGRLYFDPNSPASRNHVAKMTANLITHLDAQ